MFLCRWSDCRFLYTKLEDLYQHLSSVHGASASDRDFVCKWRDCRARLRREDSRPCCVNKHLISHAPGYKPWTCVLEDCTFPFSHDSNLDQQNAPQYDDSERDWNEIEDSHTHTCTEPLYPPAKETLSCGWGSCTRKFPNAESMFQHISVEHTRAYERCPGFVTCRWDGCGIVIIGGSVLSTHVANVHLPEGFKRWKCACGKAFASKSELDGHETMACHNLKENHPPAPPTMIPAPPIAPPVANHKASTTKKLRPARELFRALLNLPAMQMYRPPRLTPPPDQTSVFEPPPPHAASSATASEIHAVAEPLINAPSFEDWRPPSPDMSYDDVVAEPPSQTTTILAPPSPFALSAAPNTLQASSKAFAGHQQRVNASSSRDCNPPSPRVEYTRTGDKQIVDPPPRPTSIFARPAHLHPRPAANTMSTASQAQQTPSMVTRPRPASVAPSNAVFVADTPLISAAVPSWTGYRSQRPVVVIGPAQRARQSRPGPSPTPAPTAKTSSTPARQSTAVPTTRTPLGDRARQPLEERSHTDSDALAVPTYRSPVSVVPVEQPSATTTDTARPQKLATTGANASQLLGMHQPTKRQLFEAYHSSTSARPNDSDSDIDVVNPPPIARYRQPDNTRDRKMSNNRSPHPNVPPRALVRNNSEAPRKVFGNRKPLKDATNVDASYSSGDSSSDVVVVEAQPPRPPTLIAVPTKNTPPPLKKIATAPHVKQVRAVQDDEVIVIHDTDSESDSEKELKCELFLGKGGQLTSFVKFEDAPKPFVLSDASSPEPEIYAAEREWDDEDDDVTLYEAPVFFDDKISATEEKLGINDICADAEGEDGMDWALE
ncbi:hypothetical protein EXIGLDRAFT_772587 [Exidia glandulosa HHB12029]|uniref:C2H2-type domain-containing protein n=1 Tax=Exidia glandulosa HHB12029 TaxID=1314781 RepID=A0A165F7U0_EXIGL|nr:hypothetical protein EXIGLDRAFT_772587 [Exidia glandulosa HHB12029]